MSASVTRAQLVEATWDWLRPGLSLEFAIVTAYAGLVGAPLDPFDFDDAAVILRAERLIAEGLDVSEALGTARAELATWRVG